MKTLLAALLLTSLAIGAGGAEPATTAGRLRVGVVQMALGESIADNRDRIVSWIAKAATRGVRVVVFPEGALRGKDGDDVALVDQAVKAIRRAAREHGVYVLCGGASYSPKAKRDTCWMFVADPDGREVFRYDKLYDKHDAKMPGVFHVDGVPCSTMICADRWLRGIEEVPIQEGAQVSYNSAFVLGPDGSVLTRYDQLSAASPFQPGVNPVHPDRNQRPRTGRDSNGCATPAMSGCDGAHRAMGPLGAHRKRSKSCPARRLRPIGQGTRRLRFLA